MILRGRGILMKHLTVVEVIIALLQHIENYNDKEDTE
jgi:hypothetical protein